MEDKVEINIKQTQDVNFKVTVNKSGTVLDIKTACESQTSINHTEMKIIFKGRILKDADSISSLNLIDNTTMHMVINRI